MDKIKSYYHLKTGGQGQKRLVESDMSTPCMYAPRYEVKVTSSCLLGSILKPNQSYICKLPFLTIIQGLQNLLKYFPFQLFKFVISRGAWVLQQVECPTLAQVMISQFEPCVRVCADSSDPGTCLRFCVSLSLCPSPTCALSLSLSLS